QTASSSVIQLEYETECEEEEVLLTSQQEYFNETRSRNENKISYQVAKNDAQQKREHFCTCICDNYYDSFNDNYLNFIMGSNTSIREDLNDICEEEEWEVMLIGQTIGCSLKVNENKE